MDSNFKEKIKRIFGKEAFYISLFLCLCVIVTVGTFSYRRFNEQNKIIKTQNENDDVDKEKNKEISYNKETVTNQIPNAERVDNTDVQKKKDEKKKDEKSTVVSSNKEVKFNVPVQGIESRTYSYPKPVKVGENTFRTIKGVNLKSKIGTEVKAAADGIVSLVENSGVEEGYAVEIKHQNGLKTRYANLDPSICVKKGDKVATNQVIAKVGETAKVFDKETFGEFLNLQVINAKGEQVNPEKYFTLKSE